MVFSYMPFNFHKVGNKFPTWISDFSYLCLCLFFPFPVYLHDSSILIIFSKNSFGFMDSSVFLSSISLISRVDSQQCSQRWCLPGWVRNETGKKETVLHTRRSQADREDMAQIWKTMGRLGSDFRTRPRGPCACFHVELWSEPHS